MATSSHKPQQTAVSAVGRPSLPVLRVVVAAVLGVALTAAANGQQEPVPVPEDLADRLVADFSASAQGVLNEFCIDCHNADYNEAGVQLDALDPDIVRGSDAERWHEALDMIQGGEMPPEESTQPSDDQRRTVVDWISRSLDAARLARKGDQQPTLRRLTKRQYANTLSDLLQLPIEFGKSLPDDSPSEMGFTNSAAAQQTTALHLHYYEAIAREALGKAIVIGERPAPVRYRVRLGRDVGCGGHAAMIGGYQSAPIDRRHFRVEVLNRDGSGRTTHGEEESAALRAIEENIGIGMRGSSSERYRIAGDGMVLDSALPHRERHAKAWQGPSPNLKLLLRRCAPTEGPVAVRVTASHASAIEASLAFGLISRRSKEPIVQLDAAAEPQLADNAVVMVPGDFERLKNLAVDDGSLLSTDVTLFSSAVGTLPVARAGLYQIDLVWPCPAEETMSSFSLMVDGTAQHTDLAAEVPKDGRDVVVTTIAHANLAAGIHKVNVGGRFFAGLCQLVATPLPSDHPVARQLLGESEGNKARFAGAEPSLRVLAGARTDDGMDYATFGKPVAVTASPDSPAVYEFHDYLENLPVPVMDLSEEGPLSNIQIIGVWNDHLVKKKRDRGPPLLVHSIEYVAPHYPVWPPPSHTAILFDDPERETDRDAYTRRVLKRFTRRAFRGTVTPAEVDRYFQFWKSARDDTSSYEESVREALIAVLCSPRFLYWDQPNTQERSDTTLATRLAYFLWDSPPDARLKSRAAGGRLRADLDLTVAEMLRDERAWRFVRTFAREWLRMDRHEAMSINVDQYPDYNRFVKRDMAEEPVQFLHHALMENLPASVLIDSDFAMLNQNLAEFYGVKGVTGAEFRPVPLDRKEGRGGLLSQGAFLVGHSDGTQAHPIKRAVWLKERILGEPPPPPPPNVPELDPDTPGFDKLTLKQQLELHRDKPSCVDCHRKIDPYGIVFEEYDAVGRRLKGEAVDAASVLPDGHELSGVADMKAYLRNERYEAFLRSLVERLFAYATGREITFAETPEIDELVIAAQKDDRLGSIVLAVTKTASFAGKAASETSKDLAVTE